LALRRRQGVRTWLAISAWTQSRPRISLRLKNNNLLAGRVKGWAKVPAAAWDEAVVWVVEVVWAEVAAAAWVVAEAWAEAVVVAWAVAKAVVEVQAGEKAEAAVAVEKRINGRVRL
jgi:uncharacterized membrane protein YbaN (DUF454 family)